MRPWIGALRASRAAWARKMRGTFSRGSSARWLRDTTDDTILVEDRALYLALHRLEERGLIDAEWGLSENNRKARYYSLTRAGKRELTQRQESWTVYADAVFKVLRATRADA